MYLESKYNLNWIELIRNKKQTKIIHYVNINVFCFY